MKPDPKVCFKLEYQLMLVFFLFTVVMDRSQFVFQCKRGLEYRTEPGHIGQRVAVSKENPVTIYASVNRFYPGEHRVLDIVDVHGGRKVLAASVPFRSYGHLSNYKLYSAETMLQW